MNTNDRTTALLTHLPDLGTRAALGPHQAKATTLWREISLHARTFSTLIHETHRTTAPIGQDPGNIPPMPLPEAIRYVTAHQEALTPATRRHWARHLKDWTKRAHRITKETRHHD